MKIISKRRPVLSLGSSIFFADYGLTTINPDIFAKYYIRVPTLFTPRGSRTMHYDLKGCSWCLGGGVGGGAMTPGYQFTAE